MFQYNGYMKVKTLNISLPEGLVQQIDKQAKFSYQTRSSYIRQAVFEALKNSGTLDALVLDDPDAVYASLRRKKLADYLETIDLKKIALDS